MLTPGTGPFRVKAIKIGHIKRVQNVTAFGGEGQLLFVGLFGEAGVQSSDHGYTAGTKSRDKIAIHRVLIDVDLDLARR